MGNCLVTKLKSVISDTDKKLDYLGLMLDVLCSITQTTRPISFNAGNTGAVVAHGKLVDNNAVFGTDTSGSSEQNIISREDYRVYSTDASNFARLLLTNINNAIYSFNNIYGFDLNTVVEYMPNLREVNGIINHSTYSSSVSFFSTRDICQRFEKMNIDFTHSVKYAKGKFDLNLSHFSNSKNLIELNIYRLGSGYGEDYMSCVNGDISSLSGCTNLTSLHLEKTGINTIEGNMNTFLTTMAQNRTSGTLYLNLKSDTNVTYESPITGRECTIVFDSTAENGWRVSE